MYILPCVGSLFIPFLSSTWLACPGESNGQCDSLAKLQKEKKLSTVAAQDFFGNLKNSVFLKKTR
jgi:hypothetical protein